MQEFDAGAVEAKWQKRWKEADVFAPLGPGSGRDKFFMIFAYPGISGYLHVGHMRGFTYTDVITRYKRSRGFDVLFPVGFHASGIPAISLAKRIERKDEKTLDYMKRNGAPADVIPSLANADQLIEFFSRVYIDDYWRRFGFGMDFTRCMTTVSPGYKRFITWQFHKLRDRDLLITKPHFAPFCPECGPVAVDSSMTDISQGGNAEVLEFTVLKYRLDDGTVLPAATLRPETVFGVTNMWLHPDVEYVRAQVGQERWIVSRPALEKLRHQKKGEMEISEIGTAKGSDLIGKTCRTPVGAVIPILPGTFVDPEVATGVVMSVPAHAPFDWIALKDIQDDLKSGKNPFGLDLDRILGLRPITLIKTKADPVDDPAGKLCVKLGVTSQHDTEKLEQATSEIYKDEFHSGVLLALCREYSGQKVSQTKDTLKRDFLDQGLSDIFVEFSERVVCRCGTPVVIARIPDQWFIRYSDQALTERSKEHALSMNVVPDEYKRDLPSVLDWFGDRACIRQGSWLGTEFPFKKDWIIEPISDSTLYPAYYTVSKYVNDGSLKVEWMDNAFFDYVFLGAGSIDDFPHDRRGIVEMVRKDFLYWYPLDINLGGKEHKTVHFPVFLMNHVAILKPEHWPRGIYVHWWVTMAGGDKISKTKGGAEPIPDAIKKYGVDAMRLYYCHVGSANMDVEWVEETVSHYRARIRRIYEQFGELMALDGAPSEIDEWLGSIMAKRVGEVTSALEIGSLRDASNVAFFTINTDLRWYQRRGGANKGAISKALSVWARLLQPFTPHLAEELWETLGGPGFISKAEWPPIIVNLGANDVTTGFPTIGQAGLNEKALLLEDYVSAPLDDISNIKKMTGIDPRRIVLYTASEWRWKVIREMIEITAQGDGRVDIGAIMKKLMADPSLKPYASEIAKLVNKMSKDVAKMGNAEKRRLELLKNETEILQGLTRFFSSELGVPVEVYSEDDPKKYDPVGKSKGAIPLKPAIYIE
jgi:leucyl-tRNA synthetase